MATETCDFDTPPSTRHAGAEVDHLPLAVVTPTGFTPLFVIVDLIIIIIKVFITFTFSVLLVLTLFVLFVLFNSLLDIRLLSVLLHLLFTQQLQALFTVRFDETIRRAQRSQ